MEKEFEFLDKVLEVADKLDAGILDPKQIDEALQRLEV